jgi:hypothetical protein
LSAASTALPDSSDHAGLADDAHLGLERDAAAVLHAGLHMADQLLDLAGARLAQIDDEIGVLLRHHRIADAIALQARGLDQPRGVIPGRILEHRATAP